MSISYTSWDLNSLLTTRRDNKTLSNKGHQCHSDSNPWIWIYFLLSCQFFKLGRNIGVTLGRCGVYYFSSYMVHFLPHGQHERQFRKSFHKSLHPLPSCSVLVNRFKELQSSPPEYRPLEWGPTVMRHENGEILLGRYSCKLKKIWVERSPAWNLVSARTLRSGISVKMYPSFLLFV